MQKQNNSSNNKSKIARVQYSQNVINYNALWCASTYFDMGFTLASTIARTLQFLMFSGNSWMPKNEWRMEKKSHNMWKGTTSHHHSTHACFISTILSPLTQNDGLGLKHVM